APHWRAWVAYHADCAGLQNRQTLRERGGYARCRGLPKCVGVARRHDALEGGGNANRQSISRIAVEAGGLSPPPTYRAQRATPVLPAAGRAVNASCYPTSTLPATCRSVDETAFRRPCCLHREIRRTGPSRSTLRNLRR